jgi:hypothetical protein
VIAEKPLGHVDGLSRPFWRVVLGSQDFGAATAMRTEDCDKVLCERSIPQSEPLGIQYRHSILTFNTGSEYWHSILAQIIQLRTQPSIVALSVKLGSFKSSALGSKRIAFPSNSADDKRLATYNLTFSGTLTVQSYSQFSMEISLKRPGLAGSYERLWKQRRGRDSKLR